MTCLRIRLSVCALTGVLALSACDAAPQSSQARADAATVAACRQRADEVYNQQNRGAIYSANSSENAPFSANYTPGVTSRGLSALFAHDRMVNDCVRNTGTGAERSVAPPP
ncbi:hypothetical protein [Rhodopila globiformis]|uniref:Lipoprotein n=1 Tax=Rhodopila globiformis TaxID=1071 RepID=A0A2S6NEV5_RHOGL|nr:hypothetical protein [Rhodopila globiformis]PPQ33146.1 hypothetical protein CCS01_14930 [Rhodopila globiformis]